MKLKYFNRAKQTAWYLLVSNIICIVTYTSPLKIRAHVRWKQRRVSAILTFEPALFLCIQGSIADKFKVVGCHGYNVNTVRKRPIFKFRKAIEVLKEGIWSGLLSAPYQNGDQHYDIGPLCLIGRVGVDYKSPITITVPIKLSITITVVIEKAITITIIRIWLRLQLLVYNGNDSRLFIRHVHLHSVWARNWKRWDTCLTKLKKVRHMSRPAETHVSPSWQRWDIHQAWLRH